MSDDVRFRADLYRGTSSDYDRYRVPYPQPMIDDLAARATVTGAGRLVDLACGTGQVTFALSQRFSEVWAVDQEPEAVAFARAKAERLGLGNVRWVTGRAEEFDLQVPVELVTIGNAFHRLERRRVATAVARLLSPGEHLALLWSNPPWNGTREWQRALDRVLRHWMAAAGAVDRVPSNLDAALAAEPHRDVVESAGFRWAGEFEFPTPHVWTIESLTGLMYSTSVLSRDALGEHAPAFERDLRDRLLEVDESGVYSEEISFAYHLAVRA